MALKDEQQSERFKKFHSCETSEDPPLVPTLPQEIIVDILTRLLVKSLLRCKSVCKSWCSLISDPHFFKSHHTLSASINHYTHHRLIFTTVERDSLLTCPIYDVLHDKYVNALDHGNPVKEEPCYKRLISIVGSCNGLLCVVVGTYFPFIWNPCTRRWNMLSCAITRYSGRGGGFYGFGYDESTNDYKVVVISRLIGNFASQAKRENEMKIYSLKTGIWKKIGEISRDYSLNGSGKFSNGALHWAASGPSYPWTIVSIDLADETLGEVLQPVYDEGNNDLTWGVLEELLCVLCNYDGNRSDVWVMKVYGLKDSWTKLVSIPYLTDPGRDHFSIPLVISEDGKVLVQLGSELIVYDSKNSSSSKIRNVDDCFEATTYVESLVSPPVRWKLRNMYRNMLTDAKVFAK